MKKLLIMMMLSTQASAVGTCNDLAFKTGYFSHLQLVEEINLLASTRTDRVRQVIRYFLDDAQVTRAERIAIYPYLLKMLEDKVRADKFDKYFDAHVRAKVAEVGL